VKPFSFLLLSGFLLVLTGCESVRDRVHERFVEPVHQAKVVNADQHKTYEAVRAALLKMNYTIDRGGGPAQGKITALGPISTTVSGPGTARQVWFDAKLSPGLEGGTKIEVLFSELIEDDFNKRPGQGELTPLRDSAVYEAFFYYVDEALAAKR